MQRVIVIAVAGIAILGSCMLWEFCRWIDDVFGDVGWYGGGKGEKEMQ